MKLPHTVKVLGNDIEVWQKTPKQDRDLKDCLGYYDIQRSRIVIWKNMSFEQKKATLVHELAHAYVFHSGLGYVMSKFLDPSNIEFFEEKLIRSVIVPMVMTSRTFRWLQTTSK